MTTDPFSVQYDRGSDVLYVTTKLFGPAYGEEGDAPGLVWRYSDADNTLIGVTVMDFHSYWQPRFPELVKEFSSHFGLAPKRARKVLEAANL